MLSALIMGAGAIVTVGCQTSQQDLESSTSDSLEQSINRLNQRLSNLEELVEKKNRTKRKKDAKTPSGRIQSLTMRTGTEDDRLRIYWDDGSTSDLPCTKEQFIWVCG